MLMDGMDRGGALVKACARGACKDGAHLLAFTMVDCGCTFPRFATPVYHQSPPRAAR